MDKMELSLDRAEIDVVLTPKDGEATRWKLVELDGKERNTYLNKMKSRVKVSADGKSAGIKDFSGFQSDLLCMSLLDESGEPIGKDVIEQLPSKTQHKLFLKAREISGLDMDDKKDGKDGDEKND